MLESTDSVANRATASYQAVTKVNAKVASILTNPEVEPPLTGRRQYGLLKMAETVVHSGGVLATAW